MWRLLKKAVKEDYKIFHNDSSCYEFHRGAFDETQTVIRRMDELESMQGDTDSEKLKDLSEKLGVILGAGPDWKNGYVIYSDEFDDFYTQMSLDLNDGRWQITTGECGVLNLPKEAPELMARMSKLVK